MTDDAEGLITMIYIQTPRQKELNMRYGELLQLDGTYKVNKINFPIYTLLIEDNFGVGQAVGHAFLRNETVKRCIRISQMLCSGTFQFYILIE